MRAPCAERKREKEKRLSEGKGICYLERSRAHDGGHLPLEELDGGGDKELLLVHYLVLQPLLQVQVLASTITVN